MLLLREPDRHGDSLVRRMERPHGRASNGRCGFSRHFYWPFNSGGKTASGASMVDPTWIFRLRLANVTINTVPWGARLPSTIQPVLDATEPSLCSPIPDVGHQCRNGALCNRHVDIFHSQFLKYDYVGNAVVVVGRIVVQEGWPTEVQRLQESSGTATFFFAFGCLTIGSYFCLNLLLAILSYEYGKVFRANAATTTTAMTTTTTTDGEDARERAVMNVCRR